MRISFVLSFAVLWSVHSCAWAGGFGDLADDMLKNDIQIMQEKKKLFRDSRIARREDVIQKMHPSVIREYIIPQMIEAYGATPLYARQVAAEPYFEYVAARLYPSADRKEFVWHDGLLSLVRSQKNKCETLMGVYSVALDEYRTAQATAPIAPNGHPVRPVAAENRFLDARNSRNIGCIGVDPSGVSGRWVLDFYEEAVKAKKGAF